MRRHRNLSPTLRDNAVHGRSAPERAVRQLLRHSAETPPRRDLPGPVTDLFRDFARRLSLVNLSVNGFQISGTLYKTLLGKHEDVGCNGAWEAVGPAARKCADCGGAMNPL